jgi:glycine/serine hydroxymethyltransferase
MKVKSIIINSKRRKRHCNIQDLRNISSNPKQSVTIESLMNKYADGKIMNLQIWKM